MLMLNSGWNSQVKKEIMINFFNHQISSLNLDVDSLFHAFISVDFNGLYKRRLQKKKVKKKTTKHWITHSKCWRRTHR
jgi:hypothetical protein